MIRVDEQEWTERVGTAMEGLKWRCSLFEEDKEELRRMAEWVVEHGLTVDQLTRLVWVIAVPELHRMDSGEQQVLLALAGPRVKKRDADDELPF